MITQHTMAMRKPTPTHKNTLSPTHASGATTQPQHPQTTRPATQNITIVSQPTVTNYSKYQRSHRPHDDQRTEAAGASSTRQTPRCGLDWESPAPAPQSPLRLRVHVGHLVSTLANNTSDGGQVRVGPTLTAPMMSVLPFTTRNRAEPLACGNSPHSIVTCL